MTMMMRMLTKIRINFPRNHSRRVYSYFFAASNSIRRSNDSQFVEGLPSLPYLPSHRNLRSEAGNDSMGNKKEKQTSNGNDFVKNYFKNVNSSVLRTKLNVHKVFEVNTKEQLQEKLAFLEANFTLSEKKLHSVLYFHPMLLNRSKGDIERLVRHFREKWYCSDEDMKVLLTTQRAKKILALSLEDLERMHRVYSEEWKISDDKLSSALWNWHYWYKYQRHLKDSKIDIEPSENVDHREKIEKIRSFFSRKFGIDIVDNREVDRIINSKIFDENSEEELKQKIHYLSSKFSLNLSTQEIKRLVQFVPVILNESMEEMEKKVEYFKVKLGCSEEEEEEELKRIYLIRGVVVSQSMWRLELLYRILGEEYGLKVEDIKKLMLNDRFAPDRLSDMMKDVVERKHIFSLICTEQSHLVYALRVAPILLWMSVPTLKSKIRLFVEGLGVTSLDEIRRILQYASAALTMEEQYIVTNCKQVLSLFMSPSSLDREATKMVHLQELESEEKRRLEEAFREKYRKEIKMLEADSSREEEEAAKRKKKERGSEREVHAAFIEEKAATLSALSSADSSSWSSSRATRAWSIAAVSSASDIGNPYYRFLRECLEEGKRGDLLKELGGYEEERERIEKALRRGEGREEEGAIEEKGEGEGKKVGWMAMGLVGGKEVEKMALSHEEAKKICITSGCISHNFSTVLPKLISMASRLQLTGEELISIYRRNSNLTYYDPDENILPKLLEVGRAAERFVRDGEGGSEGMEAWKNGIGEAMSVEEGREYYRKHPVVRLMREFVLQRPIFNYSMNRFKGGIKQWEEDGKEKREWRELNSFISKLRTKRNATMEEKRR